MTHSDFETLKKNDLFVRNELHSVGFRSSQNSSSTANTPAVMAILKKFGPNQRIKLGYLTMDYATTQISGNHISEIYVAFFQDTLEGGYIPPRDVIIDEHLWMATMVIRVHTAVGVVMQGNHEESFINENKSTPAQAGGVLAVYSMSDLTNTPLYAAGRIEFAVEVIQKYYSDSYTQKGKRETYGWEGYTKEESEWWEME